MSTLQECPTCHRKRSSGDYLTVYRCKDYARSFYQGDLDKDHFLKKENNFKKNFS